MARGDKNKEKDQQDQGNATMASHQETGNAQNVQNMKVSIVPEAGAQESGVDTSKTMGLKEGDYKPDENLDPCIAQPKMPVTIEEKAAISLGQKKEPLQFVTEDIIPMIMKELKGNLRKLFKLVGFAIQYCNSLQEDNNIQQISPKLMKLKLEIDRVTSMDLIFDQDYENLLSMAEDLLKNVKIEDPTGESPSKEDRTQVKKPCDLKHPLVSADCDDGKKQESTDGTCTSKSTDEDVEGSHDQVDDGKDTIKHKDDEGGKGMEQKACKVEGSASKNATRPDGDEETLVGPCPCDADKDISSQKVSPLDSSEENAPITTTGTTDQEDEAKVGPCPCAVEKGNISNKDVSSQEVSPLDSSEESATRTGKDQEDETLVAPRPCDVEKGSISNKDISSQEQSLPVSNKEQQPSLTQQDDLSPSKVEVVNAAVQTEEETLIHKDTQVTTQEEIGTDCSPAEEDDVLGSEDTSSAAATAEQITKKEEELVPKEEKKTYAEALKSEDTPYSQAKQQKGAIKKEAAGHSLPEVKKHLLMSPPPTATTRPPSAPRKKEGWQVVIKGRLRAETEQDEKLDSLDVIPFSAVKGHSTENLQKREDISDTDDSTVSDSEEPRRKEVGASCSTSRLSCEQKKKKKRKAAEEGKKKSSREDDQQQSKSKKKLNSLSTNSGKGGTPSEKGAASRQQKDEMEKAKSAGYSSPKASNNLKAKKHLQSSLALTTCNSSSAPEKKPKVFQGKYLATAMAINETHQKREAVSARNDNNSVPSDTAEPGREECSATCTTTSVSTSKSSNGSPSTSPVIDCKHRKTKPAQPVSKATKKQSNITTRNDGKVLGSGIQVKQTKASLVRAARFHEDQPLLDSKQNRPKGPSGSKDVRPTDGEKKEPDLNMRGKPVPGNISGQKEQKTRAKDKPSTPSNTCTGPGIPGGDQSCSEARSSQRTKMNSKNVPIRSKQAVDRAKEKIQRNSTTEKFSLQVKQTKTSMVRAASFPKNQPPLDSKQKRQGPSGSKDVGPTDREKKKPDLNMRGKPVPGNIKGQTKQQARAKKKPNTPSNTSTGPGIPGGDQSCSEARSSQRTMVHSKEGQIRSKEAVDRAKEKFQRNSTTEKSSPQVKQTKTSMVRAASFRKNQRPLDSKRKRQGHDNSKDVGPTDRRKKKSTCSKRDKSTCSKRQENQQTTAKRKPKGTVLRNNKRGHDKLRKTPGPDQAVRPKTLLRKGSSNYDQPRKTCRSIANPKRRVKPQPKKIATVSPTEREPTVPNNRRVYQRRRNMRFPDYGTIDIRHNPVSSTSTSSNLPRGLSQDGLYSNMRGRTDHQEEVWQSGLSAVESARHWADGQAANRERSMDHLLTQLLSGLPDHDLHISPTRHAEWPNNEEVTISNQSPDDMPHIQQETVEDIIIYTSEDEDVAEEPESRNQPEVEGTGQESSPLQQSTLHHSSGTCTSSNHSIGASSPNDESQDGHQRPGATSTMGEVNLHKKVPVTSSPRRRCSHVNHAGGRPPEATPIRSLQIVSHTAVADRRSGRPPDMRRVTHAPRQEEAKSSEQRRTSRIGRTKSCQDLRLSRYTNRRDHSEERIASCGGERPVCRVIPFKHQAPICSCNSIDQGSACTSLLHSGGARITVLDHYGQLLCRKRTPLTRVQNFARSIQAIVFRDLVLTSFTLRCCHGNIIPRDTLLGYEDTTVQVFPADNPPWSWRIVKDNEGFREQEEGDQG